MDAFWVALLKPFVAFVLLLPGWFVKRWLDRHMKPGDLKDTLLKRRGERVQAWFERADERLVHQPLRRLGRFLKGDARRRRG